MGIETLTLQLVKDWYFYFGNPFGVPDLELTSLISMGANILNAYFKTLTFSHPSSILRFSSLYGKCT